MNGMSNRTALVGLLAALAAGDSTFAGPARRDNSPRGFAQPVKPKGNVGRNAPCACGSGKKSKRCCRVSEAVEQPLRGEQANVVLS